MGTLFNQPPRDFREVTATQVDSFLEHAAQLARKHNVSVSDVIAAVDVLERRRKNDLYATNGDAFDEQVAGVGELLRELAEAVKSLAKP